MDVYDYLADVVSVIQSDEDLRECFIQVLKFGSATQQVRVATLLKELTRLEAPVEVKNFVRLLEDEKLAHQVLEKLTH
jgi:hypothetical protein